MKPSARPRYRYILFQVGPPAPDRAAMIKSIQAGPLAALGAWLTRYDEGWGILRVARGNEREARRLLETLETHQVRTISTSGTIAALEHGHGHRRRELGQNR